MPAIGYTIRIYRKEDIPEILQVIKQAFAEYQGKLDPPSSAERKTIAMVQVELETAGAFVAELEGKLVGCVFFQPEAGSFYINRLSVLPEYRGRGIATALIGAVEARARIESLDSLTLSVRLPLKKQQAFYQKLGFEFLHYGTHPGYFEPTNMKLKKTLV